MNLVGHNVGNYMVTRELGAGGMGTVYEARHPVLGRKVAIKVLHDEHATDANTVGRFFQEARAAAEIGEEHIIEVIDFGELAIDDQKVVYLMMEMLEGVSLGKRIAQGPMPPAETAHVALQVCRALAASHAKGIIHRDLKPENIYLCPRGTDAAFVKVLDFGIAKLTGPARGSARTRIGTVLGTPAYMSPEQCFGRGDLDPRADIYALGVVLYEMLTTTLPFEGSMGQLLQAHVQQVPDPPSRRNASVPPEWDAIVMRCLEKDREDRFASMTDLAAAIRDPLAHATSYAAQRAARAAAPPRKHKTWVLPDAGGGELAAHAAAPDPDAGFAATLLPGALPNPALAATVPPVTSTPMPTPSPLPYAVRGTPVGIPVAAVMPTPMPTTPTPTPSPMPTPFPFGRHRSGKLALVALAVALATTTTIAVFGRWLGSDEPSTSEVTPWFEPTLPPIEAPTPAPTTTEPAAPAPTTPAATTPAPASPTPSPVPATPAPTPATTTPPPTPTIAHPAPTSARVTITSEPAGARVVVRDAAGRRAGTTPFVVPRAALGKKLIVHVSMPGHVPITRTLTPRGDMEISVVLSRVRRPVHRPRPSDTDSDPPVTGR